MRNKNTNIHCIMPVQVTVLVNILASVDSNPPEIRLKPYHLEIAGCIHLPFQSNLLAFFLSGVTYAQGVML